MARKFYTGITLSHEQRAKIERLACGLGCSRNQVFGRLVDAAELVSQPMLNVTVENNRHDVSDLHGQNVTAVEG